MSSIENTKQTIIPLDIIKLLSKVYENKGKDIYYKELIKKDYDQIVKQTIERDTYFLAKLGEVEVSEARMRLIIQKDSKAKNKKEQILTQMKQAITSLQTNIRDFELIISELYKMVNFIYGHITPISYEPVPQDRKSLIINKDRKSKRSQLDDAINEYIKLDASNEYETLILINNLYIDFYNIAPFTEKNDIVGYLLLYALLLQNKFNAFKYVSFFEMIQKYQEEIYIEISKSSLNYEEGFPQVFHFFRLILALLDRAYIRVNDIFRDYEFDKKVYKASNIESTIQKLPEIFTKNDIRAIHPYISDSTINRTLAKLRDNNEIKPLGVGRSSKWMKTSDKSEINEDKGQAFFDFGSD